jgi:hypothetical protein
MLGRQGPARELITRALRDSHDSASTCALRLAVGIDHWYACEPALLGSSALRALEEARIARRPDLVAEAVAQVALAACELTFGRAIVNVRLGRLDEARTDSDAACDGARLLHDPLLGLWSEIVTCIVAIVSGKLRVALAAGARATTLAQDSRTSCWAPARIWSWRSRNCRPVS